MQTDSALSVTPAAPPASASPHATLLLGHAAPDSLNAALAASYARGFVSSGGTIETIDLTTLRFDPVLRAGFSGAQALEPDLLRVREAIERANHVVWVFPTYWASAPAVVRAVIDRAFLPGWAFRYEPGRAVPRGLLAGRSSRVITTMDSPAWWYTMAHRRSVHASVGTGTLTFSGLAPVSFSTLYRVRALDARATAAWVERMASVGAKDATKRRRAVARPQLLEQRTG